MTAYQSSFSEQNITFQKLSLSPPSGKNIRKLNWRMVALPRGSTLMLSII